jgi:hypothetical protein
VSKLLQRLRDAGRSGVYRASAAEPIKEATAGSPLDVVCIDAVQKPLEKIAAALAVPEWFGGNWDALEDSLGDLSWRSGEGHVLLFSRYPREGRELLIDVLRSSAEYWAGRGKPFFAVFVDPGRELPLPDLYRDA